MNQNLSYNKQSLNWFHVKKRDCIAKNFCRLQTVSLKIQNIQSSEDCKHFHVKFRIFMYHNSREKPNLISHKKEKRIINAK